MTLTLTSREEEERIRGTPTGHTPKQPPKRQATGVSEARRQLISHGLLWHSSSIPWSLEDKYAIVQFILLHGDGKNWIYSKKPSIWEAASKFLGDMCGTRKTSKD